MPQWSVDELRGAMFGNIALDTQSIEAAVTGSLEKMEAVAFTGGGFDGVPQGWSTSPLAERALSVPPPPRRRSPVVPPSR